MDATEIIRDDLISKDDLAEKFGVLNYMIFVAMLLISTLIGVFYWWKGQDNTDEFLLAGRSMGTFPMAMSLIASFMSAITLLGVPSTIYMKGTQFAMSALCYPFVMATVAHFYLPVYDQLRVSTSYEYLEIRFNKWVRKIATSLFCIQMTLYMAIVVYAPALAIIQVTGFLDGVDGDVEIACALIFAVCIFYTCLGGIKAVIWTDVFQALMMFGSFLAIVIVGDDAVGGASIVFDRNYQDSRVQLFNFTADVRVQFSFWSVTIGSFVLWLTVYGTNQAQVQRYLTVEKRSQAVTALWINALGVSFLFLLCVYGGLVLYAFYYDCDPQRSSQITKTDQIFPLFVMQIMGDVPGIPGLFVAGVFSGALSTVSSGLNALASVCLSEFTCFDVTEDRSTLISKLLALGFGLLSFIIVFVVKYLPGVLEAGLTVAGLVEGPILGVFTLGMFVPFASTRGALSGILAALVFTFWMGFGHVTHMDSYNMDQFNPNIPEVKSVVSCPKNWTIVEDSVDETVAENFPLYDVSSMWYGPLSSFLCLLVGSLVSLFQPNDHLLMDKRLISPACIDLFFWLPEILKRRIREYYEEVGSSYHGDFAIEVIEED